MKQKMAAATLSLSFIVAANREEWVAIFDCKLRQDSNSSEAGWMLVNVMSKRKHQHIEILELFVCSLVSSTDALSHNLNRIVLWQQTRALHMLWIFTTATFVCFNTLMWVKEVHQCMSENLNVRPITTWKTAMDPNNVTAENRKANLMADAWAIVLLCEPRLLFAKWHRWKALCCKVCSIN